MSEQSYAYVTFPRLSIPGNECIHCGTVVGADLRCSGCGHVDPLTRRRAEPTAPSDDSEAAS